MHVRHLGHFYRVCQKERSIPTSGIFRTPNEKGRVDSTVEKPTEGLLGTQDAAGSQTGQARTDKVLHWAEPDIGREQGAFLPEDPPGRGPLILFARLRILGLVERLFLLYYVTTTLRPDREILWWHEATKKAMKARHDMLL